MAAVKNNFLNFIYLSSIEECIITSLSETHCGPALAFPDVQVQVLLGYALLSELPTVFIRNIVLTIQFNVTI